MQRSKTTPRKLTLARETLRHLASKDLQAVVGAASTYAACDTLGGCGSRLKC